MLASLFRQKKIISREKMKLKERILIEQPNPVEYQSRKHAKEEWRLFYAITMF
jgi:hypothetical protein